MRLKPLIIGSAGASVLAAWAAVAVTYFLHVGVVAWTLIVTVAALATEGAFWVVAAVLGISIIQARHEIWRRITRALGLRA